MPLSIPSCLSLFHPSPLLRFRIFCHNVVCLSHFGNIVLVCILVSSILLAAEDPLNAGSQRNKVTPLGWIIFRFFFGKIVNDDDVFCNVLHQFQQHFVIVPELFGNPIRMDYWGLIHLSQRIVIPVLRKVCCTLYYSIGFLTNVHLEDLVHGRHSCIQFGLFLWQIRIILVCFWNRFNINADDIVAFVSWDATTEYSLGPTRSRDFSPLGIGILCRMRIGVWAV